MGNTPVWNANNTKNNTAGNLVFEEEYQGNGINANSTIDFTSIYNRSVTNSYGKSTHKSLDFSNVGIPTNNEANPYANFRQYHQTRLYIQGFNNMRGHDKVLENNTTDNTYIISANLPESLQYSIQSSWEQPIPKMGEGLFNLMMQTAGSAASQAFGGTAVSGINRATTMKIWSGSQPLSLTLTIPVIDDGYATDENQTGIRTNLVEALEFLGSLCLPSEAGTFGFYTPPPSPLNVNIKYQKIFGENRGESTSLNLSPVNARIILQLGGILLVDHCIIESVSVNYPNTKTMIRHHYDSGIGSGTDYLTPLLATVTIKVTTVEAMTANYYSKMLWLKPNDMGTADVDVDAIQETVTNAIKGTING